MGDTPRDLHGADLGGIGRAGAAGENDAGHERRHFTHHADADQVGDINAGAEQGQLHRAHVGEDGADQETDERHYRQRARPDFVDEIGKILASIAGSTGDETAQGQQDLTSELDHRRPVAPCLERTRADPRQQAGCVGCRAWRRRRHCKGQRQHAPQTLGQR